MIVLDASIALGWCFPDEGGALVEHAMKTVRSDGAVVPPHFATEVANGLVLGMRRNRLSDMHVEAFVAALAQLNISVEHGRGLRGLSKFVQATCATELTAYDFAYLDLAIAMRCSLATLDAKLADTARAQGVDVLVAA